MAAWPQGNRPCAWSRSTRCVRCSSLSWPTMRANRTAPAVGRPTPPGKEKYRSHSAGTTEPLLRGLGRYTGRTASTVLRTNFASQFSGWETKHRSHHRPRKNKKASRSRHATFFFRSRLPETLPCVGAQVGPASRQRQPKTSRGTITKKSQSCSESRNCSRVMARPHGRKQDPTRRQGPRSGGVGCRPCGRPREP